MKLQGLRDYQTKAAQAITRFSFSMTFVYLHLLVFGAWIATKGLRHDPFPFNFLTMAVSLEAIFLSTFVGIAQDHHTASLKDHITKETDE